MATTCAGGGWLRAGKDCRPLVRHPDAKRGIGSELPGFAFELARLHHKRQVRYEFAAAPAVSGDGHIPEFGPRPFEGRLRVLEQGGGSMHVQAAFAALGDRKILEDLCL